MANFMMDTSLIKIAQKGTDLISTFCENDQRDMSEIMSPFDIKAA